MLYTEDINSKGLVQLKKMITLLNGSQLEVGLTGAEDRSAIMLPIAKKSVTGQEAETLKLWGVDPELGAKFIDGLSGEFQILHFDYEGHYMAHPHPEHFTPEYIAQDLLRIADQMNVNRFSYYGYSWLALVGLQLALRTDRMESLIMGGFPPYEGPYEEMRVVTTKTYEGALKQHEESGEIHSAEALMKVEELSPDQLDWDNVELKIHPAQTKQFATLYQGLIDFDDQRIQTQLNIPRLAFAGERDTIVYGEKFGSVTVDIAGRLQKHKHVLENLGWTVQIIKGADMDHTKAMQPSTVLPIIHPWLKAHLS
ncbi:alpha/beta hydrolase [Paenibacillus taichungensis]|uniref:alpha/beta fold hydrolase n=1 Tax=Paenibacillus taichungensis TaxID=484184 RepID=UPI002DB68E32|nr:alpha/beta hydrolase [Paenibacillus taichungensis]MEC0108556.1 alpha/beta hydrolase [Paenibacillus taichungensis]MEC0196055.1 alpha/beta hydrolase [Paenibacillus taichungensis]